MDLYALRFKVIVWANGRKEADTAGMTEAASSAELCKGKQTIASPQEDVETETPESFGGSREDEELWTMASSATGAVTREVEEQSRVERGNKWPMSFPAQCC